MFDERDTTAIQKEEENKRQDVAVRDYSVRMLWLSII